MNEWLERAEGCRKRVENQTKQLEEFNKWKEESFEEYANLPDCVRLTLIDGVIKLEEGIKSDLELAARFDEYAKGEQLKSI